MSDIQTIAAAYYADKANTRIVLATALAERNAEVQALRKQVGDVRELRERNTNLQTRVEELSNRVAKLNPRAPKVIARSNFAAQLDDRIAKRKVALAAFFKDNPQCRSATPEQLLPYVMQ